MGICHRFSIRRRSQKPATPPRSFFLLKKHNSGFRFQLKKEINFFFEPKMGIEPMFLLYESSVLPLNYIGFFNRISVPLKPYLLEGVRSRW